MSHLRLVPPLATDARAALPAAAAPARREAEAVAPSIPVQPSPFDDPKVVALSFFQAASGLCLCRACSMKRHPSYGG